MRGAAVALLAVLAVAGCGGGDDKPAKGPAPRPQSASPGETPSDEAAIRDWSRSLNAGEYERAASWFARNAIVVQSRTVRLPDHAAALLFNRTLPCRADITKVEDEGKTTLASFKLRRGPGGPCKGTARVRFTIKHGRFTLWRQLAEPAAPPGDSA
jgi:hypothetical protein